MDKKAIFFDMDGTLVYMCVSVEQYLLNIYEKLGLHFSLQQISTAYKAVHQWWKERFLSGQARTREAWIEFDHRLLKSLGAKGDLQRLSERVQLYWGSFPESGDEKLYLEVKSVLKSLREKGTCLAVISHRPLNMSLKSLENHAIRGYFQCVVSPEIAEAPKGKLSLEMWQFALDELGAGPNEVLHIDNDYEIGIIGAKKAGIRPILLDRKGMYTSISDCTIIHDLTEILRLLRT